MPRVTPAIAVALLVVLAGCSGFGSVDGTTRQPFDVEATEPTATPTSAEPNEMTEEPPPIIAFDPVQDTIPSPFDVVEAHNSELNGRPYVIDFQVTQTYANGTTRLRENATTTFSPNRSRYVREMRAQFRNDSIHRQLYANGTHVWALTDYDERTTNPPRILRGANGRPIPPRSITVDRSTNTVLAGLLAMNVTDVEKLDTVPNSVNEPVFRVVANESRRANPYGEETLSASLVLIVTEDGRIIEYYHEYTYVEDGERIHVEERIQYFGIGAATVDRPEWVPGNASVGTVPT